MSSYADVVPTPPINLTPEVAMPAESPFEEHIDKLRRFGTMIEVGGWRNAARILCDRLAGTSLTREREFDLEDANFRHPLVLTTAMSDLHGYHEIAKDGVYDLPPRLDDFINGKRIVDVGAYIGTSAAYFASRYPESPVLAIEPNPRNYGLLRANAARYGSQISARYAALSLDRQPVGMISHKPAGRSHMSNVFVADGGDLNGTEAAAGITPADLAADSRIGILKVDIEGAENRLFRSRLIDPLLLNTDLLMIETHENFEIGRGSTQAVAEAAARNGMELADLDNSHTLVYARQRSPGLI